MGIFESEYWRVTIALQKFVGLWPFQVRWKRYLSWLYVYSFTTSIIAAMGIRLYNEIGINLDIVVENANAEMYLFGVIVKISVAIFFREKLNYLLSKVAQDWRENFIDKEELKIMHQCAESGRRIIMAYSVIMIFAVTIFLTFPIFPSIWDFIKPLENGTRPKNLPYYAEYGFNIEEYYFPMLAQAIFGGVGTIVVIISFDLTFILIVQHVVGLFCLVNHRLNKVARISEDFENGKLEFEMADQTAYYWMVEAINMHQTMFEYVDLIEDIYQMPWFIILITNMALVGGTLAVVMLKLEYPTEVFRYFATVSVALAHFYCIFLAGQKIIDNSEEVFRICYFCKWYNLSKRLKNLVKIILIRSLNRCQLTGGKTFILSMETYCNMMKTGLSIFTIYNSR